MHTCNSCKLAHTNNKFINKLYFKNFCLPAKIFFHYLLTCTHTLELIMKICVFTNNTLCFRENAPPAAPQENGCLFALMKPIMERAPVIWIAQIAAFVWNIRTHNLQKRTTFAFVWHSRPQWRMCGIVRIHMKLFDWYSFGEYMMLRFQAFHISFFQPKCNRKPIKFHKSSFFFVSSLRCKKSIKMKIWEEKLSEIFCF